MRIAINQVSVNPPAIARVLGAVALLLVLASIAGQASRFLLEHSDRTGLVHLFNLNAERNVPTFFSVLLMLLSSLLLAVIAVLDGKQRGARVSKWASLSLGFQLMAFDEAFQFHERLIPPVRALLGDNPLGIFHFALASWRSSLRQFDSGS
jgi:hypothetical protein